MSKSTNRFTSDTTYDEAGNVVTDNKFRSMSFGYDANGRVVKATKASTSDALSVYDVGTLLAKDYLTRVETQDRQGQLSDNSRSWQLEDV